jgi:hypothetical protein
MVKGLGASYVKHGVYKGFHFFLQGVNHFLQHVFNIMELPFFHNQNVDFPVRTEKKGEIQERWHREEMKEDREIYIKKIFS